ncbi:hypothetical protein GIB67_039451 [Kingdonia uniflora]|uniref:Uncharacterized protein n=1 Tax=Kingdonia uniflora TaxID=39325 RepID=A0A7J7LIL4_9MAGN|nr:hypothetical protein GIB67_039451 [Kingdonia uniflora]
MLEGCLRGRRDRQIQRALRHGKVTILCLLMAVIVLRSTIGAGKFETPEQDFNHIRDHLYSSPKRSQPHRLLKEADTNSYTTFDLSKLAKDDEKRDPNTPYSLGPKISDWDEQRSIKNKIDYCRLHGIDIFYNFALLDAEMAGFWAKLPLIPKLLLSHPEVEFLWWMDNDAMFTDMAFEVPWERYKDHNFVMHGWNEMIYDQKNWIGLNTGSFLLRNS